MAVVPGGTKLCTRRNFNSNVASYFTNDDKVLTRREVGIGSFTVGDYKYTLSSSVTNLDTCMTCGNITYTKTENNPTIYYEVSVSAMPAPDMISRWADVNLEMAGGGEGYLYEPVRVIAYSSSGRKLFDQDITLTFHVDISADILIIDYGESYFSFETKKNDPCTTLEMEQTDSKSAIGAISNGWRKDVTGTATNNTVSWQVTAEFSNI